MNNWIEITAFTYAPQAHLAKSKLESEEIEVLIKDELNAQVCEAGADAIGGIKLCVRDSDVIPALYSLKKGGFILDPIEKESLLVKKFRLFWSKIPGMKKLDPELVLILLIAMATMLIYIPMAITTLR